ncbi:unnamed protein product [Paramecium sonneborni]|uniref:Uncharacterized protein n=1 Tax=Paramecium sonneborni TaxID=65129 RepID=A0A8S1N0B3_9CILI|nr:unnamed protein product [Paramecium sonneborni]
MYQSQTKYKNFREQYTVQERQTKFKEKMSQHPDMIPVVLEKHPKSKIQHLNKQLYYQFQIIDIQLLMVFV